MLNIFLGEMKDAIYHPPTYFDNVYEDEWITDSLSIEMIRDIDKSDVLGVHLIESPVLGPISPKDLSGGVKTLMLMAFADQDKVFNASACGDNCAKWILKIGQGKDLTINLNNRLHYEFEIKRNITIIKGDSATGKTTLINMIRQFTNLGNSSGIELVCDVPCRVLEGIDWQIILHNISGNIIFIDEENAFIKTEQFAKAVRESDNYFVLITRENLYNLPYSVEEIYGLHSSGKYQNTKRI